MKTMFIFPFIFFKFCMTFYIMSNNWQNRHEVCFDVTGHMWKEEENLVKLCDQGAIPEEYHGWYKAVKSSSHTEDHAQD